MSQIKNETENKNKNKSELELEIEKKEIQQKQKQQELEICYNFNKTQSIGIISREATICGTNNIRYNAEIYNANLVNVWIDDERKMIIVDYLTKSDTILDESTIRARDMYPIANVINFFVRYEK